MEFREHIYLGMKRQLSPPLMNGGGCCKTVEHIRELSRSLVGGILVGSITKEPRSGNSGNVWWVGDNVALNALGMPNGGEAYLRDHLGEMVAIAHDVNKVLIVNVAGFNSEEYASLAGTAIENGADAVELNLGCPNVVRDDGSRKPIASFNLRVMEDILSAVQLAVGEEAAVWVKVSPYSDPGFLLEAAAVISGYPVVKAVTAINTFPNAYRLDEKRKPVISVGFAGLSGGAMKDIGLGQAKQWINALHGLKGFIAVGGIRTGKDLDDYQTVGADAFQITTELLKGGDLDPEPFEKIVSDYFER